jgi:hypothetical protein
MSQVAFFREDRADDAEIQFTAGVHDAAVHRRGLDAESVNAAFEAEDMTLLVHSGLYSVQLQKPGTTCPPRQERPHDRDPDRRRRPALEDLCREVPSRSATTVRATG